MLAMAGYLATILEGLDDAQMQKLLVAEYGGLNHSYAETYALTGDPRWLRIANRIRDRRVLEPLAAGSNKLPGLHANTQIPKLIGLARLYELGGDPRDAQAARFFHETVTRHHSYVIGGNSEREHFGPPDTIAPYITDRTCEACNSYNMLKLTRHLWGWQPDAALFDYYERVQLNHILAHQHPKTGMFAYFMPLASGARRTWSSLEDSFWCCVGSGMESHAKHGDSIWWHDDAALYLNLFTPSSAEWRGMKVDLETRFPFGEELTLRIAKAPRAPRTVAIRLPGWCRSPVLKINGAPATFESVAGYARIERRWRSGDRIELALPMHIRTEPTPDDPRLVAYLHGPLVLAADLGPAAEPFHKPAPALVGADPTLALTALDRGEHRFWIESARPEPLKLAPFFAQYDRRTAVYFPAFTEGQWAKEESAFRAAETARVALEARTVDVIQLGEMQPERDHGFRFNHADLLSWGGRSGRQAWWGLGNYMEFDLAVRDGPMTLRVLYWGEEVTKHFIISIDGQPIATERRAAKAVKEFVAVDYPLPPVLTQGKRQVRIRFETKGSDAPIYEVRTLSA
jgi:hypothetical protein